MAKKIDYSEIVDIKSLENFNEVLKTQIDLLKQVIDLANKKTSGGVKGNDAESVKQTTEAVKQATVASENLIAVQKEHIKVSDELNKRRKLEAQANAAAEGSYNQLKAKYDLVKMALAEMGAEERRNSDAGRELIQTSKDLYKELDKLKQETGKSRGELGVFAKQVEIADMSLGEMKKALMEARKESFTGKSAEEVKALKQRIGDLTDAMGDLRAEMQVMGTENAAVLVGGLKFIAAGVEGVVGTMSVLGVESETIKNLEGKMTSLIAVTQSLAEIEDMVSSGKLRAIVIRIKEMGLTVVDTVQKWSNTVATQAQARAEVARGVATSGANIAVRAAAAVQWAWNAALAANPIGLVIAGVIALTGAIYLLSKAFDSSEKSYISVEDSTKKYNDSIKELKKSMDEINKSIISTQDEIDILNGKMTENQKKIKEINKEREEAIKNDAKDRVTVLNTLKQKHEAERRELLKQKFTKDGFNNLEKKQQQELNDFTAKRKDDLVKINTVFDNKIEALNIASNKKAKKKAEKDKKDLEDEIKKEEENIKAIFKIIDDANDEYWKSEADKNNKLREGRAKYDKDVEEAQKERIESVKQYFKDKEKKDLEERTARVEKGLELIDSIEQKFFDKQQARLDKELESSKRNQDTLKLLAARGSEDAKKNLAFEEQNQVKLEALKQKAERKKAQLELAMSVIKTYNTNVANGVDNPLQKTMTDTMVLQAFIKSLPSFKDGVWKTKEGNLDKDGGHLAVLHKNETVLTENEMNPVRQAGIRTSAELVNLALMSKVGVERGQQAINRRDDVASEIRELKQIIKDKPDYLGGDFNENNIVKTYQTATELRRIHKTPSKLL